MTPDLGIGCKTEPFWYDFYYFWCSKDLSLIIERAMYKHHLIAFCLLFFSSARAQHQTLARQDIKILTDKQIETGAQQTGRYLPLLRGKRIGVVGNQTSVIGHTHLLDSLLSLNVEVIRIFCPEHGFRGQAEAGHNLDNYTDEKTHLPVISLYGKNKKPAAEDLAGIDILIFDLQDVGARFYTYISTLHYVMEACAELDKELLVLDRPNPHGYYVDGPVLDTVFKSFVGMHPVPVIHGMTIGEYARMINGEGWLIKGITCRLSVIPVINYDHSSTFILPIPPSPNLGTQTSVNLYPSLCFFEGTPVSVGRGTEHPFERFGHPDFKGYAFSFIPASMPGKSAKPKHEGKTCYGINLQAYGEQPARQLNLSWLIEAYQKTPDKAGFFNPFFRKLAGNRVLQQQIQEGLSENQIRQSWQPGLDHFRETRKKYLLYPD